MTDERILSYTHPADIDANPTDVGPLVIEDLTHVAELFAEHVEAGVRQIRSSWQSRRLDQDADLTAVELAAEWEASDEAKLATLLVRAARQARRATLGLAL